MPQEILINCTPQETRVALVEESAVQELHIERTVERGAVGNVYLGRVLRVLPGMQSAFVDIGLERSAFLHASDLPRVAVDGARPVPLPIEKRVFAGQALLVQVIKDPIGSKGARLSAEISIAGRMLVLLPQDAHIGVSQRIAAPERDALRERVRALAAENGEVRNGEERGGGFIVRTSAEGASDARLRADMDYLYAVWAEIRAASTRLPSPALLHADLTLAQRVLRDLADAADTRAIRVDSARTHEALRRFAARYTPALADRLVHYSGERPLFDLYNVDAEIDRALGRRVELKSGGYLIVDQTEALTTIDVNTGAYVGARNFDATIYKTNLEAAAAIARQLRLRNLGGIIVVDFIDMTPAEHREGVLAALRNALARDRVRTHVGQFSPLGLVEMTRKRTRESLAQRLCEPCSQCHGSGRERTPRTVSYDILREVLREARQFNPRDFRVVAAPAVIDLLQGEEQAHLEGLKRFIAKDVALRADATLGTEQYDIVLV